MRKILAVIFCLSVFHYIHAQEQLTPLKYNNIQYRAAHAHQASPHGLGLLSDKGMYVYTSDTLSLPFTDDFSTDLLRPYNWLESHVYQTYYNVFGTCLDNMNIPTQQVTYILDLAYTYYTYPVDTVYPFTVLDSVVNSNTGTASAYYDTTLHIDTIIYMVDSFIQQQIPYVYFGGSPVDCFTQIPDTFYYSNPYYTYNFDLFGGFVIDSSLVNDTLPFSPRHVDTLYAAPVVYFSQGAPGTLWVDNYAWVNNTFPVNPPTIGVATLDGLNDFGMPYNNSSTTTYGQADYLTSKPIDLSAIPPTDSSVFLSFFFEPQGLGIYPKSEDSLIVELRDNGGNWNVIWADTGFASQDEVPNKFTQVLLPVLPQAPNTYFYNTFQFRFRNLATLTGAVDQWHIDYVKLDRNRSIVDTFINDRAFVYDFPTILKNYTLLPASLFAGESDLVDSIVLPVHNLSATAASNPPSTFFISNANETYPNQSVVYTSPLQAFLGYPDTSIELTAGSSYSILANNPSWPVDSLSIFSAAIMEPNDAIATNDTLRHFQNFGYLMGYDDGSAEQAYGLTGLGLLKFAYEFNIPKPDTLAGFQIMFDQVSDNVSDLVFNLSIWDTLVLNSYLFIDTPVIELDNMIPYYIDSVNGFATYLLDSPIIVSGNWYLGWAQSDYRNLQIGYDLNSTLGRQHMFVYLNGEWIPSEIEPAGSPMIRLILDGHYQGKSSNGDTTAVVDLRSSRNNLTVYPNPTIGEVSLQDQNAAAVFDVDVFNTLGELVQHSTTVSSYMNVNGLPNGMYLLNAEDKQTGIVYHAKLIKTSN